jgi:large subunit ribosomal protein L9
MDVILLKDVEKVGLRGDVVSVSRGYMRNYLGPRRLAEEATAARVSELEKREGQRARHEAQSFEDAQKISEALGKAELRFDVNAGPQGTLFGSVTATDVTDEIWEKLKIRVDRRKIDLPDPIKRIGRYSIPVELFPDVTAEVRTLVVPEGGELPPEEQLEAMEAAEKAAEEAEAEAVAEQQAAVEVEVEQFVAEEEVEEELAQEDAEGEAGGGAVEAEAEAVEAESEEQVVDPDAEPS